MPNTFVKALAIAVTTAAGSTSAIAENIKIGFVEVLSGPFATTGTNGLAEWEFAVDERVNKMGGVLGGTNLEVVPFDNKGSAKEALIQLQVAIDQGIKIIAQGNSSAVANAISEQVKKHNKRNPDSRVLYINYSAVDPALTNDNCNFWHFRFDANADIKMDALTDVMSDNKGISKVYLIGQDYSFGKAVAAAAEKNIAEKMPETKIVGNELHPIGKVKDFTPYARKIVNSGANAIITGNWGADMVGLGKAIVEAGYDGPIYTYYAANNGITETFGAAGKGAIRLVHEGQINPPVSEEASAYISAFKAKNPNFDITQARITNAVEMLAKAIEAAGSDDAIAVANALEGMEHDSLWGGKIKMRAKDHQAIQDVHISVHTDESIVHDADNSGFGLLTESTVTMASADSATSCEMKRPK